MASITLDMGHGGNDPGAVGNGLEEKNIALNVGLAVGEILERHNVSVVYTRETDVFVELEERANIANREDTDIFVSIHVNSFEDSTAQGIETFSYPGSLQGAELAQDIHNELLADERLYTVDRGTKTADFLVLRETTMPAALVELGFITNAEDAEVLRTRQEEFALAIAKGILNNLDIEYQEEEEEEADPNNDEEQEQSSGLIRIWEWIRGMIARITRWFNN